METCFVVVVVVEGAGKLFDSILFIGSMHSGWQRLKWPNLIDR